MWNSQLVRFACYERNDETLLGDPANKAFTDFCIRLGWKPPAQRTAFDVLPLVLQVRSTASWKPRCLWPRPVRALAHAWWCHVAQRAQHCRFPRLCPPRGLCAWPALFSTQHA